jgi:hypothetical protein
MVWCVAFFSIFAATAVLVESDIEAKPKLTLGILRSSQVLKALWNSPKIAFFDSMSTNLSCLFCVLCHNIDGVVDMLFRPPVVIHIL